MELYSRKRWWKFFLMAGAFFIGAASLYYTNRLTSKLRQEETRKMELWAKANRHIARPDLDEQSLELVFEIIQNNTTVPLIIADEKDTILFHRNLDVPEKKEQAYLQRELQKMKEGGRGPIVIELGYGQNQYLYYDDSSILNQLRWFPIVQLVVVILFVLLAYWAFSSARRREQDQVWVGMAKETAHQLGTPTSSLLGWIEVLSMKNIEKSLVDEMRYDIQRLQIITDRFSKIGSKPDLQPVNVGDMLHEVIGYIEHRISSGVRIEVNADDSLSELKILVNRPLFEWVVENLCKNAADAMHGKGTISFNLGYQNSQVYIDVSDTGKGIPRKYQKTIFKPGYTTKKRGWGLGLTLVRRIVEDYHNGRIFVKESMPGKGTTFRILVDEG
ncbi:MAG: ATP-binding protein [Anaerophaga sp.]|nr:ATP-binding protein [Anaerophaga sp.]MDK2841094.1 two-component system, sporulation sensor kinase [Anaerophaga sp.]